MAGSSGDMPWVRDPLDARGSGKVTAAYQFLAIAANELAGLGRGGLVVGSN